jgi:hypothetical protein
MKWACCFCPAPLAVPWPGASWSHPAVACAECQKRFNDQASDKKKAIVVVGDDPLQRVALATLERIAGPTT